MTSLADAARVDHEVRVTAERIASGLNREAHDSAHAWQAEAITRQALVRPALNGVRVRDFRVTGNGIQVYFVDGTQGYFSRERLEVMAREG